jgi:cell shape-determining protein MreD
MTYLFYSVTCLVLLLVQTVILPGIAGLVIYYDLVLLFVFYLSLFRPIRESLPVVLVLGFIMDNLSGATFGVYLTTYFWLFFGVRWVTCFLRVRNIVLLPLLIASGILIKNLIFITTIAAKVNWTEFHLDVLKTVGYQLLWAVITGPVFLVLFNRIHMKWDQWIEALYADPDGQTES